MRQREREREEIIKFYYFTIYTCEICWIGLVLAFFALQSNQTEKERHTASTIQLTIRQGDFDNFPNEKWNRKEKGKIIAIRWPVGYHLDTTQNRVGSAHSNLGNKQEFNRNRLLLSFGLLCRWELNNRFDGPRIRQTFRRQNFSWKFHALATIDLIYFHRIILIIQIALACLAATWKRLVMMVQSFDKRLPAHETVSILILCE